MLLKFSMRIGAKECKSCRPRKMLQSSLQKSASIHPRTSPSKFGGGKFNSIFIRLLGPPTWKTPVDPILRVARVWSFTPPLWSYTADARKTLPMLKFLKSFGWCCRFGIRTLSCFSALHSIFQVGRCWLWSRLGAQSRRAAAGRAELLAKWQHTDRLQNPAKLRRFRIRGGIIRNFRKMLHFGKIPKKIGQIWRKFSKIVAKFAKFWKKNSKNFSNF